MAIVYRNVKGAPLSADEYDRNIDEIIALTTNRANHVGTQPASTISDLASAVENLDIISGSSGLKTKLDLLTNLTAPVDMGALVSNSHSPVTINTAHANGLFINQQELGLTLASATTNGALSSRDWNIFNNKISGATNLGTSPGKQDIYAGQVGTTLRYKSLVGGNGIVLTSNATEINISLADNITNSLRVNRYDVVINTMKNRTTVLGTLPSNAVVLFFKSKVKVVANDPATISIAYGNDVVIDPGLIKPQEANQATHFDVVISNSLPTDVLAILGPSLASTGIVTIFVGYIV
jgi:hypothetical protein